MGALHASADEAADLRRKLPSLKGMAKIEALEQLYYLSQDSDDIDYQLRCVNDYIDEARRQDSLNIEAYALSLRADLFYNNDMNDSIFSVLPVDMERLKNIKPRTVYYKLWGNIANTYVYSGQNNLGIRETQDMYNDAEVANDRYGMGLAYSIMGTAYSNLRSFDQSVEAFEKSLSLLSGITPLPVILPDAYSSYGDVLNSLGRFQQLEKLTERWNEFVKLFIQQHKLENTSTASVLYFYYYLARVQAALGQDKLDDAVEMLNNMHDNITSEESYRGMSWLYYMAQYSLQKGNFARALYYNTRRLELMEGNSDKSGVINVNRQRAEICQKMGRYDEAARLYRMIYLLNDSANAQDTKNQLNEMNTIFGKTELEMEKKNLLAQQKEVRMRWIIAVSVIVAIALAVFLFFRMRAAKRLKQANDRLHEANEDLQKANEDLQAANLVIEQTTAAKERIETEMRMARNIQMSMVPSEFPEREDLDIYASMTPAKEVGGDLYDYLLLGDDLLYFCLGDVSGKGVPASLFMAQATRLFRTLAKQKLPPAEIATMLNNELAEDNEQGMFVTMYLGLANLRTGHLDFCNAGHNPPVLAGQFIEMEPNVPIGLWPGIDYVGESIDCISGKPLFIYTDGLNEAEDTEQVQFGDDRLLELIAQTPYEGARQLVEMLRDEVEKHRKGAEPNDDLTMMCLMIKKNQ